MTIRVMIADDHKITRQGLCSLLGKKTDIEVIAEAQNGRNAVELAKKLHPDVIIMDVSMPDLNGVEASKQIIQDNNNVKIIALSMHSDSLFVSEMLKSGASGYLLKDCAFEELEQAIRTVLDGKAYLSPSISGVVVEDYLHRLSKTGLDNVQVLTDREREVLQLLAEGKSTKQIALKLHISAKTVETHRRQIMNKLDIHTVAGLTKYAIRKGLTALEA
ncbi:MAG: response regulator transcription factor [Sedimentisphaerales bacterium]|nr:response regulator transcription factor [Sedimentisphaerales bacterium]